MTFPDLVFIMIGDLELCIKRMLITTTLALKITIWVPDQNFSKGWFILHITVFSLPILELSHHKAMPLQKTSIFLDIKSSFSQKSDS